MLNQSSGLELNDKGYLVDFDAWNRGFAVTLAKEHDLELTDCHWLIVDFLRDYFSEYRIAPEPAVIIKNLSSKISPDAPCNRKHLEGLFAGGGCELACKIAGLPDCHCRGV